MPSVCMFMYVYIHVVFVCGIFYLQVVLLTGKRTLIGLKDLSTKLRIEYSKIVRNIETNLNDFHDQETWENI